MLGLYELLLASASMEAGNLSHKVCKEYGGGDASQFGKPLPWIGTYVAIASFVCAVLIWADIFRLIHWRKYSLVPKYYALNATTVTVLSVAIKLPTDINTGMPGLWDQMAKLSGILLVCATITHTLPSLGAVRGAAALSNLAALLILVVTLYIDICIQISTGVIKEFRVDFIIYSTYMVCLLMVAMGKFIITTSANMLMEDKYNQKVIMLLNGDHPCTIAKLRELVGKYWLIALSCSPATAMYGYEYLAASSIYTVVLVLVFGVRALTLTIRSRAQRHCFLQSDYQWSIGIIYLFQVIAAVGSLAQAFAMSKYQLNFAELHALGRHHHRLVKDLKSAPLSWRPLGNRYVAKAVRSVKNATLAYSYRLCTLSFDYIERLQAYVKSRHFAHMEPSVHFTATSTPSLYMAGLIWNDEFHSFLLQHHSGQKCLDIIKFSIESGHSSKAEDLHSYINLSRNNRAPQSSGAADTTQALYNIGAGNATGFHELLPPCWSLTIITLHVINLHASFNARPQESPSKVISQVLKYAVFVDQNFPVAELTSPKLVTVANMVWEDLDHYNQWLGEGLADSVGVITNFSEVLNFFKEMAMGVINGYLEEFGMDSQLVWPFTVIAAKSMYDITSNIIGNLPRSTDSQSSSDRRTNNGSSLTEGGEEPTQVPTVNMMREPRYGALSNVECAEELNDALRDVMIACLSNVPYAILKHCYSGDIAIREEKVRKAAHIVGEVEDILVWLGYEKAPDEEVQLTTVQTDITSLSAV